MTHVSVHRRRMTTAAALGTAAVLLSGCTAVMAGSAVRDPAFHPGEVTVALLQTGNYPTAPTAPPAPDAHTAAIVEAQRMAEYVVYPWDVDPRLTSPDKLGLQVIQDPKALSFAILSDESKAGDPVQTIGETNGYINGFATTRGTPANAPGKHMGLYLMVMRFPDPAKATTAATALNAAIPPPTGSTGTQPIPIPGHADAQATTYVMDNGHIGVTTTVAHGAYVFHVFTQTDDTAAAAAATLAKTLDLQGPRIDQFQPTDPAQFATMNLDPTGMKVRTLQRQDTQVSDGVYNPAALLHMAAADDPQVAIDRFHTFGIDLISNGKAVVYRAKDSDAAGGFADTVAKDFADNATPKPAVPGFPGARCFTLNKAEDYQDTVQCVGTADRYVILVFSKQGNDAIQQISAQYLMLKGT